jgi:hypothetical protein
LELRAHGRLLALLSPFLLAVSAMSQAGPLPAAKGGIGQSGFTWTETFEGSDNSDGFITNLDSTVPYVFGKHFAVDMGVPYLFIQPATSKTGTTSTAGLGTRTWASAILPEGPRLTSARA